VAYFCGILVSKSNPLLLCIVYVAQSVGISISSWEHMDDTWYWCTARWQ